jgi:hypothetical protein
MYTLKAARVNRLSDAALAHARDGSAVIRLPAAQHRWRLDGVVPAEWPVATAGGNHRRASRTAKRRLPKLPR